MATKLAASQLWPMAGCHASALWLLSEMLSSAGWPKRMCAMWLNVAVMAEISGCVWPVNQLAAGLSSAGVASLAQYVMACVASANAVSWQLANVI